MKKYRILTTEYEKLLSKLVKRRKLTSRLKNTSIRDASRIFESLIHLLPQPLIEAMVKVRGFKGSYSRVIRDLKSIVKKRKR